MADAASEKWVSADGHVIESGEMVPEGVGFYGEGHLIRWDPKRYGGPGMTHAWPNWAGADPSGNWSKRKGLGEVPGLLGVKGREAELDRQGVAAEVVWPTLSLSAVERAATDEIANRAAARYNEHVERSGRVFPLYLAQRDLYEAVKAAVFHYKAVGVIVPMALALSQVTESAWASAAECGVPLHWHCYLSPKHDAISPMDAKWEAVWQVQRKVIELIETGVFIRHPKLKVVFAGADVGWIGHLGWKMQVSWDRWLKRGLVQEPIYVWKALEENVAFVGTAMRDLQAAQTDTPLANLMWGTGWPGLETSEGPVELLREGEQRYSTVLWNRATLKESNEVVKRWYPQVAKAVGL